MNTDKLSMAESEKKEYETPTLTLYGKVEELTRSNFKLGSGDAFMLQNNLCDVLAS